MTVLWAKKAYGDLDEIANYLAGLSDEAAERTIDHIQKAVLLLGEFPLIGQSLMVSAPATLEQPFRAQGGKFRSAGARSHFCYRGLVRGR